jgi:hypothetical protein
MHMCAYMSTAGGTTSRCEEVLRLRHLSRGVTDGQFDFAFFAEGKVRKPSLRWENVDSMQATQRGFDSIGDRPTHDDHRQDQQQQSQADQA